MKNVDLQSPEFIDKFEFYMLRYLAGMPEFEVANVGRPGIQMQKEGSAGDPAIGQFEVQLSMLKGPDVIASGTIVMMYSLNVPMTPPPVTEFTPVIWYQTDIEFRDVKFTKKGV